MSIDPLLSYFIAVGTSSTPVPAIVPPGSSSAVGRAAGMLLLALVLAPACRVPGRIAAAGAPPIERPATTAKATPDPVGLTNRVFDDLAHGRRLVATIWYPAVPGTVEETMDWDGIFPGRGAWDAAPAPSPRRLPLVLLSHGSGGDGSNLAWLAEDLATHGYLALAVDHAGDRLGDVSIEGRFSAWRRPADLSAALSQLISGPFFAPLVDPRRIAAVGHSAGGLTVLLLAGARIRPEAFLAYCDGPRAAPDCDLIRGVEPSTIPDLAEGERSHRDRRIRAVVAMDPVFGPAATASSLRQISIPVEIIASPTDEMVPFADNAERYARLIPGAGLSTIPQAGHFVFMPVCNTPGRLVAASVCVDPNPGVDRAAVHDDAAARILEFLGRTLGVRP
jgi:predicted dienelactone hydrolase